VTVVFVCENNRYGMSMSVERSVRVANLAERALGYGIPGVTVDGNDLLAVYEATSEAVDRARRGDGPTLVEAVTYRHKGHSKSDKNLYRTREEIAHWRTRDPILAFEAAVRHAGTLAEPELNSCRDRARDDVRDAVRLARAAPDARPEDLIAGVFAAPAEAGAAR
jgi:pyruvate dehydrogenase E1 component alpha subunit